MSKNLEAHAHPVDGAWMVTSAQLADNRGVTCTVSLTATYKFASFTAVAWLEYLDAGGGLLGRSQQWQRDCGPAPLFGAAHASGTFSETAPEGTVGFRIVQTAEYHADFSTAFTVISLVFVALGLGTGTGPVAFPQGLGGSRVMPHDWMHDPALAGRISVAVS
ncbi:hypothetical protein [Amycolatopsis balhimycina]|nr:hypothetical protein [Amycolatopsis balhimycina]